MGGMIPLISLVKKHKKLKPVSWPLWHVTSVGKDILEIYLCTQRHRLFQDQTFSGLDDALPLKLWTKLIQLLLIYLLIQSFLWALSGEQSVICKCTRGISATDHSIVVRILEKTFRALDRIMDRYLTPFRKY